MPAKVGLGNERIKFSRDARAEREPHPSGRHAFADHEERRVLWKITAKAWRPQRAARLVA
jgi:hypothetical protein